MPKEEKTVDIDTSGEGAEINIEDTGIVMISAVSGEGGDLSLIHISEPTRPY